MDSSQAGVLFLLTLTTLGHLLVLLLPMWFNIFGYMYGLYYACGNGQCMSILQIASEAGGQSSGLVFGVVWVCLTAAAATIGLICNVVALGLLYNVSCCSKAASGQKKLTWVTVLCVVAGVCAWIACSFWLRNFVFFVQIAGASFWLCALVGLFSFISGGLCGRLRTRILPLQAETQPQPVYAQGRLTQNYNMPASGQTAVELDPAQSYMNKYSDPAQSYMSNYSKN